MAPSRHRNPPRMMKGKGKTKTQQTTKQATSNTPSSATPAKSTASDQSSAPRTASYVFLPSPSSPFLLLLAFRNLRSMLPTDSLRPLARLEGPDQGHGHAQADVKQRGKERRTGELKEKEKEEVG